MVPDARFFAIYLRWGTMTFGAGRWGADEATSRRIFDAYADAAGNFFDAPKSIRVVRARQCSAASCETAANAIGWPPPRFADALAALTFKTGCLVLKYATRTLIRVIVL